MTCLADLLLQIWMPYLGTHLDPAYRVRSRSSYVSASFELFQSQYLKHCLCFQVVDASTWLRIMLSIHAPAGKKSQASQFNTPKPSRPLRSIGVHLHHSTKTYAIIQDLT